MGMHSCSVPIFWYFGVSCVVSHLGKRVMWALRGWNNYVGVTAAGRGACQHVFQVHLRLGGMLQME